MVKGRHGVALDDRHALFPAELFAHAPVECFALRAHGGDVQQVGLLGGKVLPVGDDRRRDVRTGNVSSRLVFLGPETLEEATDVLCVLCDVTVDKVVASLVDALKVVVAVGDLPEVHAALPAFRRHLLQGVHPTVSNPDVLFTQP